MRHRIRTFVAVAVAIVLMVFFLRNVEMASVANAIASARRDFLLFALLMVTVSYFIRAIRWRYLLAPVGHVELANAVRATLIGFAASAILPGRVGEVLRPYVLARREQLSASTVFATIVVERVLDLVAILVLFGFSVTVFDPAFAVADDALLGTLRAGAGFAAAGAVGTLAAACFAAGNPVRVGRIVGYLTAPLSERVSELLVGAAKRFTEGLAVMREFLPLVLALGWSVVLWVTIAAGLWLVSVSFGIQMPMAGGGVLVVLVALGVAVPTPGGIGGYHAAYQIGVTGFYAATEEAAVGAGLLSHAVSVLPVTVVGIVLMAKEGMRLTRIGAIVDSGRMMRETMSQDASVVMSTTTNVRDEGRVE